MAKFKVYQCADYVMGHLRYGHREGLIEADSKEDALYKLEEKGYTDYLDVILDDYSIEDVSYGINKFEIEEVESEEVTEETERPKKLDDFMAAIMKEARRNSLVDVCENWGISEDEMEDCISYIEEKLSLVL